MGEKFWLASYPPGIPGEVDVEALLRSRKCCRKAASASRLAGVQQLRRNADLCRLNRLSRDFAAFLQKGLGLNKGERVAIMLPNLLQYPVALFGSAARRAYGGQCQSAVHRARTGTPARRTPARKAIVVLENFARTLQQVLHAHRRGDVITTELGDLLPVPKRCIVNFVVKQVKKMVPDWSIGGAIDSRACAGARAAASSRCAGRPGGHRLPAVHRRHHRRGQGRHAHAPQHGGQSAAGAAWMSRDLKEGEGDRDRAVAAVSHLLPDRDCCPS